MRIANGLMTWATRLMPAGRQAWAEAMREEYAAVDERDRLDFAMGCLWVACRERIDAVQILVVIGRWGVGLGTLAYAGFHLFGAASVLWIMLSGHDHYRDLLIAHGHVEAAAQLRVWRPWLELYLLAMGVGNLVAAVFLIRWRPKLFMAGCALVAVTSAAYTAYGIVQSGLGTGTFWGWQFVPLFMLAGAAAVLAWVANRRPGGVVV